MAAYDDKFQGKLVSVVCNSATLATSSINLSASFNTVVLGTTTLTRKSHARSYEFVIQHFKIRENCFGKLCNHDFDLIVLIAQSTALIGKKFK